MREYVEHKKTSHALNRKEKIGLNLELEKCEKSKIFLT